MADTTISALTPGIPAGNDIVPYGTSTQTLGTPVNALFKDANTFVVIGSAMPAQYKLDVYNDNFNAIRAVGNSTNSIGIYVDNKSAGARSWGIGSVGSAGPSKAGNLTIFDHTAQLPRFNIDAVGNVGIGVNDPQAKLHVNGTVTATGFRTSDGTLPMFGANAFVHFNGGLDVNGNASTDNTTRRIYAGGNVSSVLRNTTGLYTIYFTTAMTNTEYLAVCSTRHLDGTTWDVHCEVSNRLTTSCVVNIQSNYAGSAGSTAYDPRNVDVMIIC